MKIEKVFEDKNILVVNKPSGLVVNKSETAREETLQDQLADYFQLNDLGIGDRAGIVHRLDRQTSGLLAVAKSKKVFEFLQEQFRMRQVNKEYIGLVHGFLKDSQGSISGNIGRIGKFGKFGVVHEGREAETDYKVINRYSFKEDKFNETVDALSLNKNRINYLGVNARNYTLVKIVPKSGRTHQIRVHLKSMGNSVVSDNLYTSNKLLKFDLAWCSRLFLHASYLSFRPLRSKSVLEFKLDLPNDLKESLNFLNR